MVASPSWVPAGACTLPTAEQPLRVAEFAELFRASLREVARVSPGHLRLVLDPGVADAARTLVAREVECCTFFRFAVAGGRDGVTVDVRVPPARAEVLDGLHRQAAEARRPG